MNLRASSPDLSCVHVVVLPGCWRGRLGRFLRNCLGPLVEDGIGRRRTLARLGRRLRRGRVASASQSRGAASPPSALAGTALARDPPSGGPAPGVPWREPGPRRAGDRTVRALALPRPRTRRRLRATPERSRARSLASSSVRRGEFDPFHGVPTSSWDARAVGRTDLPVEAGRLLPLGVVGRFFGGVTRLLTVGRLRRRPAWPAAAWQRSSGAWPGRTARHRRHLSWRSRVPRSPAACAWRPSDPHP